MTSNDKLGDGAHSRTVTDDHKGKWPVNSRRSMMMNVISRVHVSIEIDKSAGSRVKETGQVQNSTPETEILPLLGR